jgi:hypothetical protein
MKNTVPSLYTEIWRVQTSKRRRAASEFGMWSWWPVRSEAWTRPLSFSFTICCLQRFVVAYSQPPFCNYTLPPRPSANTQVSDSPNKLSPHSAICTRVTTTTLLHQRSSGESSPSRSSKPTSSGSVVHQSTDGCSERESPTRLRSSPLRLDPQASPDSASRLPLQLAHLTACHHVGTTSLASHSPSLTSS